MRLLIAQKRRDEAPNVDGRAARLIAAGVAELPELALKAEEASP